MTPHVNCIIFVFSDVWINMWHLFTPGLGKSNHCEWGCCNFVKVFSLQTIFLVCKHWHLKDRAGKGCCGLVMDYRSWHFIMGMHPSNCSKRLLILRLTIIVLFCRVKGKAWKAVTVLLSYDMFVRMWLLHFLLLYKIICLFWNIQFGSSRATW